MAFFRQVTQDFKAAFGVFKLTHVDILRIVFCCILVGFLFYPDFSNLQIIAVVAGFILAMALLSHIARIFFFPYVDLRSYAMKALEEPMSAAVVFASVTALISVLLFVAAMFFK